MFHYSMGGVGIFSIFFRKIDNLVRKYVVMGLKLFQKKVSGGL